MLTKNLRSKLMEVFGYESWRELRPNIKQAKHPFPYTMSWEAIARGKKRNGKECIHNWAITSHPDVDKSFVSEEYIFIRFHGSPVIWRYLTSTEAKNSLKDFDLTGESDLEEGDVFVAEPMTVARNPDYQNERRAAIRAGTWEVKVRGPNTNMRRGQPHHYRPF
jgi:hypothetical protein